MRHDHSTVGIGKSEESILCIGYDRSNHLLSLPEGSQWLTLKASPQRTPIDLQGMKHLIFSSYSEALRGFVNITKCGETRSFYVICASSSLCRHTEG